MILIKAVLTILRKPPNHLDQVEFAVEFRQKKANVTLTFNQVLDHGLFIYKVIL